MTRQPKNSASERPATERARVEAAKAFLVAKSTHLHERMVEFDKLHLLLAEMRCKMGKDHADTQMALGDAEARAKVAKEAVDEAKNQASTAKEAQAAEVLVSKAITKAVDSFKAGGEYRQIILDSYKKSLWQSFELCKKWVTGQFLSIDIEKLIVEPSPSSEEDSIGSGKGDSEEGKDPASLL